MSSFGGTTTQDTSDPTLQLAPPPDEGPDMASLIKSFQDCMASNQSYIEQCQENYSVRYALWPGQTSDGKKHAREGGKVDPTPWDGASDLRVFLTDEAINSKVAMECMALEKANLVAVPVEGNDIKRAKTVSTFMRWLVQTQIPELDREMELLSNYVNEKGLAVTGQFWEVVEEKTLTNVSVAELQAQFPNINVMELLVDEAAEEQLLGIFEEIYGCTRRKAKRMLSDLRTKQATTVPTVGRTKQRPVIRAFNLDENIFISNFTSDLEMATGIYRVEYFPPEKLRSFVNTNGWDEAWVEAAIEKCKGQLITFNQNEYAQPVSRSMVIQEQRFTDQVAVVYAYQRLSDEDGVPGIYCTIFNPLLNADEKQDGYAKHGLLGYSHGQYPFVLFRREYLSRKLHDSRGIPEPGKPLQDQIKVHKDSLVDAASLAILPPMMYPVGRPPGRWGAGARIPERRPGEYRFADRPAFDISTEKSEAQLRADFNQYFGFQSKESDPTFANLKNQFQVNKRMRCFAKALKQVWSLWNQFGPDEVYYRVIGVRQEQPMKMDRGAADEEFDFYLSYDVLSTDPETQEKKLESLAKICATFDKYGQIDYSEVLQLAVETIDSNWADRLILPKETGSQKIVDETNTMLAQVFAGVDRDIDLNSPPEMVMSIMQNYAQQPDVQQRLQQDQSFRQRFEKLAKQTEMQITQKDNAKIGRYGA